MLFNYSCPNFPPAALPSLLTPLDLKIYKTYNLSNLHSTRKWVGLVTHSYLFSKKYLVFSWSNSWYIQNHQALLKLLDQKKIAINKKWTYVLQISFVSWKNPLASCLLFSPEVMFFLLWSVVSLDCCSLFDVIHQDMTSIAWDKSLQENKNPKHIWVLFYCTAFII